MKRSGFLRRKTPLKSRSKPHKAYGKELHPKVRSRLPTTKKAQEACDKLMTPIAKKLHPYCELCGAETQVGHHFFFKSQSNRLRHEEKNIISLCNRCHGSVHGFQTNMHTARIISIRGIEWYEALAKQKQEYIKADVHHYLKEYERLETLLRSL